MKTGLIVSDGLVTNAILLDDDADPAAFGAVLGPEEAGIGWAFDGETWTPPEAPAAPPAPPPDLTARQLRLGLLEIGIKPADVTAAIEQLPSPDKERAEIEWEYANTFQREHPLIAVLAAHFGLSKEAVDEAWEASAAL